MRSNKLVLFLQEIISFLLTEVLAIFVAFKLLKSGQIILVEIEGAKLLEEIWKFLLGLAIVVVLILLFLRFSKKSASLFKIFFYLAIFAGCQAVFSVFVDNELSYLLAFVVVLWRIFVPKVWVHNLIIILGIGGVSSILGLGIPWQGVVLILVILSIYDFIAVYKTKHMIYMFKSLVERGIFFSFIFPQKISDMSANLKQAELPVTILEKEKEVPFAERKFMFLGTGDIALPAVLAVSVLPLGLKFSILVVIGSLLGLTFVYLSMLKRPRAMPALPPIAFFSVLFLLLGFLL